MIEGSVLILVLKAAPAVAVAIAAMMRHRRAKERALREYLDRRIYG